MNEGTASPQEFAHQLLVDANGIRRNAERRAWDIAEQNNRESPAYRNWSRVAITIAQRQEFPRVEDRDPVTGETRMLPSFED